MKERETFVKDAAGAPCVMEGVPGGQKVLLLPLCHLAVEAVLGQ